MKILKRIGIVLVFCFWALVLFLPDEAGKFRNLPLLLLLIVLATVWLIWRSVRRLVLLVRISRAALKMEGRVTIKLHPLPNLFRIRGRYDITITTRSERYCLFVCVVGRRYLRYHFDTCNTAELYAPRRMTFTQGRNRAPIFSSRVEWRERGRRHFAFASPPEANEIHALVMNRFPSEVADCNSRGSTLGNGDRICGEVYLFDLEGFLKHLKAH